MNTLAYRLTDLADVSWWWLVRITLSFALNGDFVGTFLNPVLFTSVRPGFQRLREESLTPGCWQILHT